MNQISFNSIDTLLTASLNEMLVINKYFQTYFMRAATVGAELHSACNGTSLKWMTFSYLVSLFFDCPAGMGLECPTAELQENVTRAIKDGHIWWPAFPHNAELATGDASFLRFGVNMSRDLASKFDVPLPRQVHLESRSRK